MSSATAGLGVALAGKAFGQAAPQAAPAAAAAESADALRVAVIGCGAQGRVLIEAMLRIPSVRIAAICDIWSYSRQYTGNYLKKYGHVANVYEDYRELLAAEKDIDAAVVATPDWVHAEQTNACLRAGWPVYCEKEMANTLDKARSMVLAARETGKLLQIGHQRRSNPRYIHAIDRLIRERSLLGRVTVAYAQWNRAKADLLGWPEKYVIDQATLDKYGYSNMTEFRNWRLFKKFGGGPMVDLGSHQIDLFSWVYGTHPASVVASGGARLLQELGVVRQRHGHLRVRDEGGHGPGLLPGPDDDPARRLLRDLHGRERLARPLRDPRARQLGHARAPRPRVGFAGQGRAPPVRGRARSRSRRRRTSTSTSG
ncbi:MAG: Gfo/Idh/MocA family oxidoreductase [Ignavibacteriales bacterium]|nr:Gfo/Idh/MocA family oxidoreductase [Ignavibacteriales bacterium]